MSEITLPSKQSVFGVINKLEKLAKGKLAMQVALLHSENVEIVAYE